MLCYIYYFDNSSHQSHIHFQYVSTLEEDIKINIGRVTSQNRLYQFSQKYPYNK